MELFNHTATFKRQSHFPITTQALDSIDSLESTKYLVSLEEGEWLGRVWARCIIYFYDDALQTAFI